MKCPKCGRFIPEDVPCAKCYPKWFHRRNTPLWKRALRLLKAIICLGGE